MKKCRFLYIDPTANSGKIEAIEALHTEYLRCLQSCINALIEGRRFSLGLTEFKNFFQTEKILSTNIVGECQRHSVAIVLGWSSSLHTQKIKAEIARRAREGLISEEVREALNTIGKRGISRPTEKIAQTDIDLYWTLLLAASKPPRISNRIGIRVKSHTAVLSTSKKAKFPGYWLALSHLGRGRRIQLPLIPSPYVTSPAQLSKGGLLRKDRQGRWRFEFVEKEEYKRPVAVNGAPRVGVDVGMNVIAATSDGRLYGQNLKPQFDRIYTKVKKLRANRQRQNLRENSPRLDRMEEKLTGLVKSATGKIANKLVKSFPEHTFVIEDLDLRGCRGQKRFAYRALQKSLEEKAPVFRVNPAYTSQECPSCGYILQANRSSTKFACRSCGRLSHADVVGGINLLGRSESKQVGLVDDCRTVKRYLRQRYRIRRNSSSRSESAPARLGQRLTTGGSDLSDVGTASNNPEFNHELLGAKPPLDGSSRP